MPIEYLIDWVEHSEMTWEPIANLEGAMYLVDKFEMERQREEDRKNKRDNYIQNKPMRNVAKLSKSKGISKAGSIDKGDLIDKVIGISSGKGAAFGFSCKVKW